MSGNRKAATDEAVRWLEALLPGSDNGKIIREQLEGMSDQQFEAYMTKLESGEEIIPVIAPNLSDSKLTITRNLGVAKQLGHDFFQQLTLTDPVSGTTYLTPKKYLVVDLPVRRQQQMLVEKISVSEDNRHIDLFSGQVVGPSKSASITTDELLVLYAQGFDRAIEELIKFRGGDEVAYRQMTRDLVVTGGASQDSIKQIPSKVRATTTLSTLLKGAHLDNTL